MATAVDTTHTYFMSEHAPPAATANSGSLYALPYGICKALILNVF
jgi:hypothetical protein